jgi:hypothetical protein
MSRRYIYFGSFASAAYFTDLFGVPKVAYALRKLSPNTLYSGAAIRVRRSSDNTEQDINFTSSAVNAPLDTSALTSFVGANDGFVTTWYDQSGNGIDISQSTASNQPKIVNAGSVITMNSKTSISFASASNGNFLQTTSNNHFQSSILDIYSVMKVVSYSGFGTVFWGFLISPPIVNPASPP